MKITINEYLTEQEIKIDQIKQLLLSDKKYDISFNGKPSNNGWKISIVGKKMDDIYELYDRLHVYLEKHNIAHKIATKKRIESGIFEQNRKLFTIYVPDDIDMKILLIKIEYLLKGYTGWYDIKLPFTDYEVYAGGIMTRNDRDENGEYIPVRR